MTLTIKFLIGMAPPFERYLTIIQAEYPMVHCFDIKKRNLLVVIMKRLLQSSAADGKDNNDLLKVDLAKKKPAQA